MRTSLANFSYVTGVRVADVRSEIDISNSDLLEADLAGHGEGRLIVALSDCPYIDSSGLRVLIHLSHALGSRLAVVAGPGCHARRLIDIAGLTLALRVYDSLGTALSSFGPGRAFRSAPGHPAP